jgi:restriction system protein
MSPYNLTKIATHGNEAAAVFVETVSLVAVGVLIVWGVVVFKQRQQKRYVQSGLPAVDQMSGIQFEQYVAAKLRECGWHVAYTPATGDFGVDLIAKRHGRSVAVQCKRYGKSVGILAVQQVVSGTRHHHCASCVVVSNREFTPAAKRLAATHNCVLVGRSELPTWRF